MRLLKVAVFFLFGIMMACGGSKNNSEAIKEAPVKVTSAYYITEVGGTPDAPSRNKYIIELNNDPEGVVYDSLYINGEPVEMMRMKNRPVIYGGSLAENFTGVLKATLKGKYQNQKFELKLDSVYQKEKVFLPSSK